jgi:uncharacterized lipoprotein YmbA
VKSLLAFLIALPLLGCGTSSEPNYYALSPTPGATQLVAPHLVEIRKPGIAGYLDRDVIVKKITDHRLNVSAGDQWGEPLGDMIGRVVAEDLSARIPSSVFFSEGGALEMSPDSLVEINVERMDVGDEGAVVLVAQVAVEPVNGSGPKASKTVTLRAPCSGSTESIVGAASNVVGQLSDVVVALLQTPPQPASPETKPNAAPPPIATSQN